MKNSKLFRRGFAWLLTLSMCLGMLQVTAFAEETEASAGGDVTVSVVNVSSDAPQETSSDTAAAQQESSTPPADTPSGAAGDIVDSTAPAAGSSNETENPENSTAPAAGSSNETENPENSTAPAAGSSDDTENHKNDAPAAGSPEDAEDSEGSENSVQPVVDSDDDADEDNADKQAGVEQDDAEQAGEETSETVEKDDSEQDGAFDLAQTERPEQSDTVSVGTGTTEDQTEGSTPESGKNWEIFYDKENDVYKLTFNIDSDAEGDQVIDMTHALKLLNEYAQSGKDELEAKKAEMQAELEGTEEYEKYKADYAEYEKAHAEDMAVVKQILKNFGKGYDITGKTEAELIAEFNKVNKEYGGMFGELTEEPDKPESIKAIEEFFKNRVDADVLQPGDVRKFMIFLSSGSNHTYKYQEGSFTLATPDFGLGNNPEDGTLGFDGQILPDKYIDDAEYHVTLRCDPIQNLLVNILDVDKYDAWNGFPKYVDKEVKTYLQNTYGQDTVAANLNAYLLDYYNSKDGTAYQTIDELVKNNPDAKAELTKTDTSGNKFFKLNGEEFIVDAHLETERYNQFYQALLSFAYGNKEDIDKLLGEMTEMNDGRFEYDNDSWTDNGYMNALYYYMAHKEIWATTDKYFQDLLKEGLTADQATWASFMMAVNIDGELTGNDWQNTKWPWYNSIKLEQMDIDFSLTKTDKETGEAITNSETGFQVYYIDKVKSDDGTVSDVKMYCSYDAETNSYTFVPTESTVWTKGGKLDINYAMMKDIVYYLQESVAPAGYEKDANVYIIMNKEDYNAMSDEDKAALGKFNEFLETQKSEDGLKVSVEFTNAKVQIPTTTPEEPTPPPTPEEPDDPTPPTTPDEPDRPTTPDEPDRDPDVDVPEPEVPLSDMPEEPFVSISEEDVPLADTPEEVEIDDPEVPMGDVPRTGDAPVFPLAAAALCICGMLLAKLGKGNKEM